MWLFPNNLELLAIQDTGWQIANKPLFFCKNVPHILKRLEYQAHSFQTPVNTGTRVENTRCHQQRQPKNQGNI